jgi:hypothetical protein
MGGHAVGRDGRDYEPFGDFLVGSQTVASKAYMTKILFYAPSVPQVVITMEDRDRKVVIVGVLVVLMCASLGTAFALGPPDLPPAPFDDYLATWVTESRPLTEGGVNDQTVSFDIPDLNVTSVTVRLTWTDDEFINPIGRRDDTLAIRVEGPADSGMEDQDSGTSGELVLQFDLVEVPSDDDPENMGLYLDEAGTGEWRVTVSVSPEGLRDTGNSWSVTLSYTFFTGRLVENPEVA